MEIEGKGIVTNSMAITEVAKQVHAKYFFMTLSSAVSFHYSEEGRKALQCWDEVWSERKRRINSC